MKNTTPNKKHVVATLGPSHCAPWPQMLVLCAQLDSSSDFVMVIAKTESFFHQR